MRNIIFFLFFAHFLFCSPQDFASIEKNIKNKKPLNNHDISFGHISSLDFSINIDFNNYTVAYIKAYSAKNNLIQIAYQLQAAKIYKKFVLNQIDKIALPRELFFIPMIEARYNPNSMSRTGAAGLWQFMLNSINPYLKVTSDRDERKDFWLSTIAGLKKLKENYKYFKNWNLAIAAYNMGLGGLDNAIKRANSRDFWYLYKNNYIPKQTKDYVLKFLAFVYIGSYPGRYGITLSWKDENVDWRKLDLKYPIFIKKLQKIAKIPDNLLLLGNSEYKYGIATSDIKVPKNYENKVLDILKNQKNNILGIRIYKIEKGDTIYDLAIKYDVSSNSIISYNKGLNPSKIRAGQIIRIPYEDYIAPSQSHENKKSIILEDRKLYDENLKGHENAQELDLEKQIYQTLVKENDDKTDIFMRDNFSMLYIVEKNDTLKKIARQFGFTVEFLMLWNEKTTEKIKTKEQLLIPLLLYDNIDYD